MRYIHSYFLILVGFTAFALANQCHHAGWQLWEERLTTVGWFALPVGTILLGLERFVWRKGLRRSTKRRPQ